MKTEPTLADLDALPPGMVGEIIDGVLYTMTKPQAPSDDGPGDRR